MESNGTKNLIEKLGVRYGVLMTAALVGYFFLMKAVGLEHNLELRAFNLVILVSFVLMAIKHYRRERNGNLVYLRGIGLGLLTAMVGTLLFAILVLFYVTVASPEFMGTIRSREPFGDFLNPFLVACTIIIEGAASGFLAAFGIMQYFKPSQLKEIAQIID